MTEVAVRSDVPASLADQMTLAEQLSKTTLLPTHLQNKPANVLGIMYAANALGIPLWQAMQSMQVINGKVGISADLARALILGHGHSFRVVESTDQTATVEIVRAGDTHVHSGTFTKQDAMTAGLWGKGAWATYPKAMLVARATMLLGRQCCADVLMGMSYTPEELGANVDEDGTIVSVVAPHEDGTPRSLEELPRNQDGSISRSQISEDEKAANNLMTAEQQAEHTALQVKKDSKKATRSAAPVVDEWTDQPAGTLDLPLPASQQWCDEWQAKVDASMTEHNMTMRGNELTQALAANTIGTKQHADCVAYGKNRRAELTANV